MPQGRSPGGDHAHGRESADAGYHRLSSTPCRGGPILVRGHSRSSSSLPPSRARLTPLCSAPDRLCSPSSATADPLCHRPSQGSAPSSPPLRLAPASSPSRWLSPPTRALLRSPPLPRCVHRRLPMSVHLRPHHPFEEDCASPYFIYVHTFSVCDLPSAPLSVTFSRLSPPPSQACSGEPPFHPTPPIGPSWTRRPPRQHLPCYLIATR
jgi:hypothetical protein